MGKTTITIRLANDKREALDAIAAILGCDRSHVLNEAIDAYLDTHRWQIWHIKKGLRQAKSGQFASEGEVSRALKVKAGNSARAVSELGNSMARKSITEDAEDLGAFLERAAEPNLVFKDVLKHLKLHRRA